MTSTVPLPSRMRALDRDRRGYPIPFIVLRNMDGTPNFSINDSEIVARCLYEHLCAICGQELFRGVWLVGGPLSAFHENGCYSDTPLHHECAAYALQVCPYLAAPRYDRPIAEKAIQRVDTGHMLFVDNTMMPDHPKLFVAVMTTGVEAVRRGPHLYVIPQRPYMRVEYWRAGRQLDEAAGQIAVQEALAAAGPP